MTDMDTAWRAISPTAPVVVVGAGIIGCSAAYHLLKAGARNVVVLDAKAPGEGTTAAGAGFVALWAAGRMPIEEPGLTLERYALDFYRRLAAGHDIAYRNNGNLVLALTPQTWQDSVLQIAGHPAASPGTRILSPAEVAEITGVIDAAAVHAAVLMPSAIQIETGLVVQALASLITNMGGMIRTGVTVEGFSTSNAKVRAVITSAGEIDAAAVVLAAGAWTNSVLQHLGVRLPLLRVIASRLLTQALDVPDTMPTIQCDDFGMWIRESGGRFTWGSASAYRPAYRLEHSDGPIPPGQPHSQALLDVQRAEQPRLEAIIPRIADADLAGWMQGMPVYTPDSQLFVGQVPAFGNVVVLAGDNESGVTHAPGVGRVAGELIRGVPTFANSFPCRLDRFDPEAFPDEESVGRYLARSGIDRVSSGG